MEQIQMVQIELLHPHEQNPRIDAAQVEDLAESIREHGIEVPLVVVPPYDGTEGGWVVIAGHRRLTAAHAVGLTEVPVLVRADLISKQEQLAFMASENVHRDQLTPMEESRLVQDMLELGMTQAQVAKQTALGKQRVRDRVKLSKLAEDTGEKVHRGQVSIDDALVIAEYSDDPETVQELEAAAGTQNFDYYTSRAKARREARTLAIAAKKKAKKNGIRIVGDAADFVPLLELSAERMWSTPELDKLAATAEDDEWAAALADSHKDCPGHCVQIIESGAYAGTVEYGCDQVATLHDIAPGAEDDGSSAEPVPEPKPNPFDRFTPEDLRTMRIDRQKKVHTALTSTDLTDWATEEFARRAVLAFDRMENFDRDGEYRAAALAFLGLPADATTHAAIRVFNKLPWPARFAFIEVGRAALFHHVPMAQSATAWMWGGRQPNHVDELLHAIGAEPSDLEKELRTLHNNPWDTPTDEAALDAAEDLLAEAGAALAEGGEAA